MVHTIPAIVLLASIEMWGDLLFGDPYWIDEEELLGYVVIIGFFWIVAVIQGLCEIGKIDAVVEARRRRRAAR